MFLKDNITIKRPNIGLEPHFYDFMLGRVANYNYQKGEGISKKKFKTNAQF